MRTIKACFFLVSSALALRSPRLEISQVECSKDSSDRCSSQCTINGCYGATHMSALNTCLTRMDRDCSVFVKGTVNVTLEDGVDFCNVTPTGGELAGWVMNVPYMGSFERMGNPFVQIPRTERSILGRDSCEYLVREMSYRTSYFPANIENKVCTNPVEHTDEETVTLRDFTFPAQQWVYPVAVTANTNAMFLTPRYQSCWAPVQTLQFTVDIEHDFPGGPAINLQDVVFTGTPSSRTHHIYDRFFLN